MGPKTLPGVFVGYHVNPGGEWSGDYLVADLEYFRKNPDVPRPGVKVHRIKEVGLNPDGKFVFPVAVWRRERLLKGGDFEVSEDVEEVEEQRRKADDIQKNFEHESSSEPKPKPETALPAVASRQGPKVGRNDACPCGSGKKYKQCHGKLT